MIKPKRSIFICFHESMHTVSAQRFKKTRLKKGNWSISIMFLLVLEVVSGFERFIFFR